MIFYNNNQESLRKINSVKSSIFMKWWKNHKKRKTKILADGHLKSINYCDKLDYKKLFIVKLIVLINVFFNILTFVLENSYWLFY